MAVFIGISYGIMALLPILVGDIPFIMNILVMCLIWAVVASCWDVMMGFAGIFTFGQVSFFVIGAYCSAILSISHHITPALAIILAGFFTAGIGVLVGLPCLRLAGPYIALVTFGVHMALQPLLRGEIGLALGSGGAAGLLVIPPINLFGYAFTSDNIVPTFYLILLISLACILTIACISCRCTDVDLTMILTKTIEFPLPEGDCGQLYAFVGFSRCCKGTIVFNTSSSELEALYKSHLC